MPNLKLSKETYHPTLDGTERVRLTAYPGALATTGYALVSELSPLVPLGTAADKIAYTTGAHVWAETPLTAFARTMLDDTNAAAVKLTLGIAGLTTSGAGSVELASSGAYVLTVPATGVVPLGTGTSGYVARWTGTNTLGTGALRDTGTTVSIGAAANAGQMLKIERTFDGSANQYGVFNYVTSTPTSDVTNELYGNFSDVRKGGAYNLRALFGFYGRVAFSGSAGVLDNGYGMVGSINLYGAAGETGTITNGKIFLALAPYRGAGNLATITNLDGMYIENMGASYVTTARGLYLASQTGATTNWGIYSLANSNFFSGPASAILPIMILRANATTPGDALQVQASGGGVLSKIQADGVIIPVLTTTAGAPTYVKGGLYFDTTLNKLRIGGAAAWETVTSA